MANKTAYIISLKFAPGLKKEFKVLGENIRQKGLDVRYFISEMYLKIEDALKNAVYINTKDGFIGIFIDTLRYLNFKKLLLPFSEKPPDFVCFYNPHTINPILARLIKQYFPSTLLCLYLHDPYKPDKSFYGFKKALYITIAELIQKLTVRFMDIVVSPSQYSLELFKRKYPNFKGNNFIAPLLIPDQYVENNKKRKYFSIIGIAHPATGHDTFIELVNYVATYNLNYKFVLISSSNIESFIKELSNKSKNILKVINNKLITDYEINDVIRQSYAVFRLDKEVTQSGVVPVSYMNETPVIARDIQGLTQHVWHKKTGYVVPFDCSPQNLIEAMNYVRDNFTELSKNARKSYEEIWAEWNFDKYYGWLVMLLNKESIKGN